MDILTSLAIVTLAALIHASFQLSVSVFTLLNSHTSTKRLNRRKTLSLTFGFVAGAGVMTLLSLSFIALVVLHLFGTSAPQIVWAIVCGLLMGVGVAVWVFYYRKGAGTTLWVPRSFARHLSDRSKQTVHATEAFSLGLTSVVSELLFIAAPMIVSALVLVQLPGAWQLIGIAIYAIISLITLLSITILIGSGRKLSAIQRWRESNKRFLQFSSGGALAVLGLFVYVCQVVADVSGA